MNKEEARLYLEHTSKDDFNLEEHQKVNRYEAIQVALEEIERLSTDKEQLTSLVNSCQEEIRKLKDQLQQKENIIKEVREIFKDYGEKEDIVGYSMYNITGEMLLKLLEILEENQNENN